MDCIADITENDSAEKIVVQNKIIVKEQQTKFQIDKQKQVFEKELEKYKTEFDKLITEELNGVDVTQKYKEVAQKINDIKNLLKKHEEEMVCNLAIKTNNSIKITSSLDREFDEPLIRQLIHKINVISKEEIEVEFVSAVKVIKKLEI